MEIRFRPELACAAAQRSTDVGSKGRTKMWEGKGWIKLNEKTVVVK